MSLWAQGREVRWPTPRIKDVVTVVNGYPFPSDGFNNSSGIPVIRIRDLLRGRTETFYEGNDIPPEAIVHNGDLLIGMDGDFNSAIWTGGRAGLNQRMCKLVAGPFIEPRYLAYFVDLPLRAINDVTYFTTVKHLSSADLMNEAIPLPTVPEQRAIADYLDTESARIDALIAKKRRMIELLHERRSEVSQVLTGSSPVLAASQGTQLRRVARLQAGAAFPHIRQGESGGELPYVKVGDLSNVDQGGYLQGAANRVSRNVAAALRSPVLPVGTIVLPKIGAALLTNRRAILSEPSCLDQNVMGVTVEIGNPRFVFHCLSCVDLGLLSTPGPVPLLNEDVALSVRLPWPSEAEQQRIAGRLDRLRAQHLVLIGATNRQIDLLAEHRRALITAAVTGELDIAAAG